MSRYIDADDLAEPIAKDRLDTRERIQAMVDNAEEINPFEVVDPPPDNVSYINQKGTVVMNKKTFEKYQCIAVYEALRNIKEEEE